MRNVQPKDREVFSFRRPRKSGKPLTFDGDLVGNEDEMETAYNLVLQFVTELDHLVGSVT